jgi:hypothetical protein
MDGMFGLSTVLPRSEIPPLTIGYTRLWALLKLYDDSGLGTASSNSTIAPAIIRYLTFAELELTHTCHKHVWAEEHFMDKETITEIQEEEEDIIRDLEPLVEEFCQGCANSSYSFGDYITEVMWPRLDTFQREKMSEHEVNGLDELALNVNLVPNKPVSRRLEDY